MCVTILKKNQLIRLSASFAKFLETLFSRLSAPLAHPRVRAGLEECRALNETSVLISAQMNQPKLDVPLKIGTRLLFKFSVKVSITFDAQIGFSDGINFIHIRPARKKTTALHPSQKKRKVGKKSYISHEIIKSDNNREKNKKEGKQDTF